MDADQQEFWCDICAEQLAHELALSAHLQSQHEFTREDVSQYLNGEAYD